MDAFEIAERVKVVERDKARLGRIDWYDRNVPNWWKNLKDLFDDPVWEGDLEDYCAKWFGKSETEMREFLGLSAGFLESPEEIAGSLPEREKIIEELNSKAKKALRQARWRAKQKEAGK